MTAFSAFLESPKDVSFESQEKGEHIVFLLRRHWVINVKWVIMGLGFLIFPVIFWLVVPTQTGFLFVSKEYSFIVGTIWYLFTFIFILENYLIWYFNVYIVTDRRIIDTDFFGIIHKKVSEAPLRNIEDSTYNVSGVLATMFNFGTVKIQTAAELPEFEFEHIPNPGKVHEKINDLINYNLKKRLKKEK